MNITLGSRIDRLVSGLIDKEVHVRLNGVSEGYRVEKNTIHDHRLMSMLNDKKITLKNIKEQSHNLFNEAFIDFLRENHDASHFIVNNNSLACIFGRKQIAVIDSVGYPSKRPRLSVIKVHVKDIVEMYNKNAKYKKLHLYPAVDEKIEEIVDFAIKRVAFSDMIEYTKGMRYKASEVRHSLDEERQEILEGDMYDLVKYYGQKIGLELKYQEEDFRNDFELK